jgi:putative SOS response-associated peptidase YedK
MMCGRMNVSDNLMIKALFDSLGIVFKPLPNEDLRPSQVVATITSIDNRLQQHNTTWGIKPAWSKKLLINAQSETVATKQTFKNAFAMRRCLVPCDGWYEWRDEGDKRKKKYLFSHASGEPFYMAGIWHEPDNQLVTLTTRPNDKCAEFHHRMPVLIEPTNFDYWFNSSPNELASLMSALDSDLILVTS